MLRLKKKMISKEDVEHVGILARIKITYDEKEKFVKDLAEIIDYVAELENAPTENVETISQISNLEILRGKM